MATNIKAIEVSGEITERRELRLDEPLSAVSPGRVRVIILLPEDTDTEDERVWLHEASIVSQKYLLQ
jgi:hypothetical protein